MQNWYLLDSLYHPDDQGPGPLSTKRFKSGGGSPKPPDYKALLNQQAKVDRSAFDYQTQGNRPNVSNPYGSSTWSSSSQFDQAGFDQAKQAAAKAFLDARPNVQAAINAGKYSSLEDWAAKNSGNSGPHMTDYTSFMPSANDYLKKTWTNEQKFAPEQQALFDAENKSKLSQTGLLQSVTDRVNNAWGKDLDISGAPQISTGLGGFNSGEYSNRISDAAYNASTRFLNPQLEKQTTGMETRLAEQGFVPGTPAYTRAMGELRDSQGMQLADARDRAVMMGEQASGAAFDREMGARNQYLAELLQQRALPMQELQQLRGALAPTNPFATGLGGGSSGGAGMQGADVMGAGQSQYQNALGNYNAKVNQQNSNTQAGVGLAAAAATFAASDARLKKNIRSLGRTPGGVNVYSWDWTGEDLGPTTGVIAQEHPDASFVGPDGYLMVDYSKIRAKG